MTRQDKRAAIAAGIILLGFVLLVLYVLLKPADSHPSSRHKSTKVRPETTTTTGNALRRGASLIVSAKESVSRFRLTRQRLWLLVEHFQVLSHLSITYNVSWPDHVS